MTISLVMLQPRGCPYRGHPHPDDSPPSQRDRGDLSHPRRRHRPLAQLFPAFHAVSDPRRSARHGTAGAPGAFPLVIQFIRKEVAIMRALLLAFCLFAVAACVEPPAAPATAPEASSAPPQDAGGYTVVITPPTAATAKTAAQPPSCNGRDGCRQEAMCGISLTPPPKLPRREKTATRWQAAAGGSWPPASCGASAFLAPTALSLTAEL